MDLHRSKVADAATWDRLLTTRFNGHILQSWEWGEFKARHGWKAERLIWKDSNEQPMAMAQILERRAAAGLIVHYCPRGPAIHGGEDGLLVQVLSDLGRLSCDRGALFLRIDPPVSIDSSQTNDENLLYWPVNPALLEDLKRSGWRHSSEQIQFRNTMLLGLNLSEDQLLAKMKQKTRYNIRLAMRQGVRVRLGTEEDLGLLYRIYAETSLRDRFAIREPAYYHDAWGTFLQKELAQVFIAEVDHHPLAGLILFHYGKTAYFFYGMSAATQREKMPNYLLQWEAIRWAKQAGCECYDLWGAPDHQDPQDAMWGVYRFKMGFGANLLETIGAWDYPARPLLYRLYTVVLPRILSLMRMRGRAQTRKTLD